jgi:hypothetical protein
VGWLIAGLLGLVFLGGLVVFIRRRHSRPSADDTLVTDLLGPPDQPTAATAQAPWEGVPLPAPRTREEASPAPQARAEGEPAPAPQARAEGEPAPAPQVWAEGEPSPIPALPAGEGDWLETQLAWINAWSQRMNQQITSAEQPEPHGRE